MAEHLPQFIALKSVMNQKYLVYRDQVTDVLPSILQCSGENVESAYARFKVEKDVNYPYLVHIKSTYIDKYWRVANQNSPWIVAGADEKQPIPQQWSCTQFKPEFLGTPPQGERGIGIYRFHHKRTENPIRTKSGTDTGSPDGTRIDDALALEQANPTDDDDAFIVERLLG